MAPPSKALQVINYALLIITDAFNYSSIYAAPPFPVANVLLHVSNLDPSYIIILLSKSFIVENIPPPFPVEVMQSLNKLEFVITKEADFTISMKTAPPPETLVQL